MNERQKLQLGLIQTETEDEDIHCDFDVVDGREENQSHDQNITPKDKKAGKKRSAEEETKAEERKKKKMEELKRLEARNEQLEDIIKERMRNENEMVNSSNSQLNDQSSLFNAYSLSQPCTSSSGEFMSPAGAQDDSYEYTWQGSQSFLDARCSAFRPYTYVGDLMSPPPATPPGTSIMQPLLSYNEVQERNRQLELENQRLREENESLKEQLKTKTPTLDFDVTPRKVIFLKQLANSLDSQNCAPKEVPKAKPTRLAFDELESIAQPDLDPHSEQLDVGAISNIDCPNKMPWEESVMSSGVKKIKLIPEYEVYLTQGQLSQAIHTGSSQPRKLTIALLDCFFTKEMLARSSAKGARNAHNATFKTTPLPAIVIRAIKDFVLKHFKKELGGEPCLTEASFNEVINNKCATARRALKSN